MDIREAQSRLAIAGLYDGAVDGMHGKRTAQAIEALLLARPYAKGDWRRWPGTRRGIAAAQLFCVLDGIEVGAVDGLMGPQTLHTFEVYAARKRGIEGVETWRDAGSAGAVPARLTNIWPSQSQREMEKFFGPVGANQATLQMPKDYPLRIAWDLKKSARYFSCHKRIHDAASRVLARVLDHYGPARIRDGSIVWRLPQRAPHARRQRLVDARLGCRARFRSRAQPTEVGQVARSLCAP